MTATTQRWPIRVKVAASGVIVALLISAVVGIYHPAKFRRDALRAKQEQVAGAAEMLALSVSIGLHYGDFSALTGAFTWARRDSALAYIAVVDSVGHLFAAFNPDSLAIDPIVEASRSGVRERDGRYITTAPIRFQGVSLGTLVLASSLAPIHKRISEERQIGLLVSLAVLVVGTLVSLYVAGRISRPIVALRNAVGRIAEGDYTVRVAPTTNDEVGALARAFASMTEKISGQIDVLAQQASELAEARDTAVEATSAKSVFLASMSHEIRTPMNGVLGMLDLLREEPLTTEQLGFAETAYSSAEALLTVINDVLDFSKIEAGRLTLETIEFDPLHVVEEVAGLLAERADAKHLEFVCDIAPNLPQVVSGDPIRLRQILLNLTGNALKFTESGSVLVRVTVEQPDDHVAPLRFDVIDTGIGLSPEEQARLFQPFEQAGASTTRLHGGTGLGLVICRQLAKLMGADIYLRSAEGAGSTFGLVVPFPYSNDATSAFDTAALCARHILVVDDSEVSRRALESLTAFWGARCTTAADAGRALQMLGESALPDVVLIDVDMPGTDGIALAKAIRANASFASVRLILLSPLHRRAEARRMEEALGCDVLLKPIRPTQLYATLTRAAAPVHVQPKKEKQVNVTWGGYLLVAEDNAVNQRVAIEVLQRLGYRVDIVSNGSEAVDAVRHKSYDAVLMDCQMPGMNGLDATEAIRRLGFSADALPIIALTANAGREDRERCLAAGMNDYMSKPLRRDVLQATLTRWIAQRSTMPTASPEPQTAQPLLPHIIDFEQLRAMVGDDRREQRSLLDLFIETSVPVLEDISASLASRHSTDLRRAAHNLRGSALTVGAIGVAESARTLEAVSENPDWDSMTLISDELHDEFARTSTYIQGMTQ